MEIFGFWLKKCWVHHCSLNAWDCGKKHVFSNNFLGNPFKLKNRQRKSLMTRKLAKVSIWEVFRLLHCHPMFITDASWLSGFFMNQTGVYLIEWPWKMFSKGRFCKVNNTNRRWTVSCQSFLQYIYFLIISCQTCSASFLSWSEFKRYFHFYITLPGILYSIM